VPVIPEKSNFKIGEVAKLLEVRPSVLRFWETEFKSLRPEKTRSGQRIYTRRHIEELLKVKDLLYVQGFTIAGAKRLLKEGTAAPPKKPAEESGMSRSLLERVKKEVRELLQLVSE